MSLRNSKTNSSPVTRPLSSARVTSKALSRSAQLKSSGPKSSLIPNPASPARGVKGSAHIVSFAEAKRTNDRAKAVTAKSVPAHASGEISNANHSKIRGNHVSEDLGVSEPRGAHVSMDLPEKRKFGWGKKNASEPKKKRKLPALPFGNKRGKEFVIPSGEDLTTDSTNVFRGMARTSEPVPARTRKKSTPKTKTPSLQRQRAVESPAMEAKAQKTLSSMSVPSSGMNRSASASQKSLAQSRQVSQTSKRMSSELPLDARSKSMVASAPHPHEPEEAEQPKRGIAKMLEGKKERRDEKKRVKAKAKADKKFDKAYGASNKSAAVEQAGPRAALYSTKMGSTHKKSAKMQMKDVREMAASSAGFIGDKVSNFKIPEIPKYASRLITAALVVVVFGFGLYGPAQQYYVQMRETDRLQAEFIEVAQRTNNLADSIDALQTTEGIEDKAHSDLGYVKTGEKSATVKGIASVNLQDLPTSNVAPGSIPAPDTWYSGALDVIFGYTG